MVNVMPNDTQSRSFSTAECTLTPHAHTLRSALTYLVEVRTLMLNQPRVNGVRALSDRELDAPERAS